MSVLAGEGLRAWYRTSALGVSRDVRAVDGISFTVEADEIYGLAGESSSGKTTLIKTIAAATQPPLEVVAGTITFTFPGGAIEMQRADRLADVVDIGRGALHMQPRRIVDMRLVDDRSRPVADLVENLPIRPHGAH